MKFIHVSDTHLGCEIPIEYRNIRRQDFINAFKQVIDYAIRERVDFIIHTGDFFDDYFRISSDILEQTIDLLVSLKKNNIPLIVIKGNHDVKGHRQKVLELLKKLGLIIEANPKNPIEIRDIAIYGISEPANITGDYLQSFYKKIFSIVRPQKDKYNIFMFHGAPDIFNFFNDPRILPLTVFPSDFDYYAFGHFHQRKLYNLEEKIYALPGSTERTEISRREEKTEKGFYLIENNDIKFIPIKTRKISVLEHRVYDENSLNELIKYLSTKNKEMIIKVKVETVEQIKEMLIKKLELLKEEGYLILYEILSSEEETTLDSIEINENLIFEQNNWFSDNERLKKVFNILKSLVDEYYIGRSSDIEKIRELARNYLIRE